MDDQFLRCAVKAGFSHTGNITCLCGSTTATMYIIWLSCLQINQHMKKIHFGLWILTATILIGCQKDDAPPPPPPLETHQLVTTGYLIGNNNLNTPCYWIGSEKHELDQDDALEAYPYGFDKIGNDIYIAGGYSPDGFSVKPCYWKNGDMIKLPTVLSMPVDRTSVRDVRWFNDAIYFLGDVDLAPYIWKIKNSIVTITPLKGNENQPGGLRSGGNMEVHNGILYIAGNEAYVRADGTTEFMTGFFTVDQADHQQFHVMEDDLGYALSGAIAVSDKGLYINGQAASNPARVDEASVMWTNNGRMPQVNLLNRGRQRVGQVVIDAAGDVYTTIYDIQDYKPVFWKLTPGNNFQVIKPPVPAGAKGFCHNLAILGNKFAYAYSYEVGNKYFAYISMDDKHTKLEMNNNLYVELTRTRIFEQ